MKTKKLSLVDFEAVGSSELLELKGGTDPCPHCENGTRCNGAYHANTNVRAGAYAAAANLTMGSGTGSNPLTAITAFVAGSLSDFFLELQIFDYYDGFSTQGNGSKVDIWADTNGYNAFPNTFGGMHNSGCDGSGGTPVNKPYDPFAPYAL
ncbi:hypothetical protein [Maribacter arenosus]|uniref:Uncharacterized protein n=1 Tax=Maribacter arenosus TaxID=1854708 RepID=A0ABR7V957_9FLAO|nr:hypothetical protein [Maribacter arenosus]MBD0849421.1 hypothetical protein [Maribacter arenosus]